MKSGVSVSKRQAIVDEEDKTDPPDDLTVPPVNKANVSESLTTE